MYWNAAFVATTTLYASMIFSANVPEYDAILSTRELCQPGRWYHISDCRYCYCESENNLKCTRGASSNAYLALNQPVTLCDADLKRNIDELSPNNAVVLRTRDEPDKMFAINIKLNRTKIIQETIDMGLSLPQELVRMLLVGIKKSLFVIKDGTGCSAGTQSEVDSTLCFCMKTEKFLCFNDALQGLYSQSAKKPKRKYARHYRRTK